MKEDKAAACLQAVLRRVQLLREAGCVVRPAGAVCSHALILAL
ncbi:hypothetical protein [Megalodesulfovibrio gigas]|nr:hypothetical protein [Megalodesulfovibrio gigas]